MASKISISVGGRFHSDQMLSSFLTHGYSTELYTSYPESRFRSELRPYIQSFVLPEVLYRGLRSLRLERLGEQAKMKTFGNFLSSQFKDLNSSDALIIWSSFAKESFEHNPKARKILMRDSTHISNQMDLLITEYEKFGVRYLPDPLCISRELKEYELANEIWVLSHYAKKTFVTHGISASKIKVLPLGVNSKFFSPRENLEVKKPLQVVYLGTLSFRKGIFYLLKAFQKIPTSLANLTVIGPVDSTFISTFENFKNVNYLGPLTHKELKEKLPQFDCYCLPSLEEGFPNTVVQAMASGLVPITCENHGVAEYLKEISDDFFVKPQSSDSIIEKIEQLSKRKDLPILKKQVLALSGKLTWENYSQELKSAFEKETIERKANKQQTKQAFLEPQISP